MMRCFLSSLLQEITGKPRQLIDVTWDRNIWIANIFRAWEFLFGRRFGIQKEAMTWSTIENGRYVIHREFYTLEAFLAHCEAQIRLFCSYFFLNPDINYQLGAIALDVANTGTTTSTTPLTFSHTNTGSNLHLAVGVGVFATIPTISTPTYNSVSMTLVGSQQVNSLSRAAMYFLSGPASGANTVSVGFGGTSPFCNAVAVSYTGAAQTGQPDASGGGTGASAPSINLTTIANNCWVACILSAIGTTGGNQTSRGGVLNLSGTHDMEYQDSNGPKTPAGAYTNAWSAATTTWAGEGGSFSPFVAAASTPRLRSLLGVGL